MGARNYPVVVLAAAACLAALALHAYPVFRPMIVYDDFQILVKSLTLRATSANLWVPSNEHAMPLGRLSTFALVQIAGRPTLFPLATALQGPLALWAAMGLLYLFVRRELGHPFYGLVAMALLGVSSIYQQAVSWFSASFSILALVTLFLALLAAQRWRQTGRFRYLALSALWTGLAPAWFASGILAGPLCALYLLPPEGERQKAKGERPNGFWSSFSPFAFALVPLAGTAAFLVLSLPRAGERIMHSPHYEGKTAWQAFDPMIGTLYTGRSVVDNLALGAFGISGVHCPLVLVPVALSLLGVVGWWWWRPVSRRRLLVLGLGLIFLSYLLVYSARAGWDYEGNMNSTVWGRYHLLPQLGLALLICGGLPRWQNGVLQLDPGGSLSRLQIRVLALLIAVLFVSQLPRGLIATRPYEPQQIVVLRQIENVDRRCRTYHIAADTARVALGELQVPGCGDAKDDNGWELLRGSDDPSHRSVEETRRLLTAADGP